MNLKSTFINNNIKIILILKINNNVKEKNINKV